MALAHGLRLPALIPFGYAVVTAVNLTVFRLTKRFEPVRFVQILTSLCLPFLFQWSLGGFHLSGVVMLWAMLAVVGSMTFTNARQIVVWLVLYSALTIMSGFLDPTFRASAPADFSQVTQVGFIVINVVVISLIVFGLMLYLLVQRENAARALAFARDEITDLQREVDHARKLGQYTLTAKLGAGGMGEVYRAQHGMLRRETAVKLLRPDLVGEQALARFEREVQLTATLTHPNTIKIFDYGRTDDGVFYYAMEFLEGADLWNVVAESGPMAPGRVLRILEQATAALSEAHAAGLVHRDIKPANIFLMGGGFLADFVKVVDFGLVREIDQEADDRLTGKGGLTGTPHYMSPETLLEPESVSASSDIYSLGCVAYFLLTGDHVFTGRTVVEVCSQHLHAEPAPMSERGVEVPRELEELVRTCLSKKSADRPSCAQLLSQVAELEAAAWANWSTADASEWWSEHAGHLAARLDQSTETLSETQIGRKVPSRSTAPAEPAKVATVPARRIDRGAG